MLIIDPPGGHWSLYSLLVSVRPSVRKTKPSYNSKGPGRSLNSQNLFFFILLNDLSFFQLNVQRRLGNKRTVVGKIGENFQVQLREKKKKKISVLFFD